MKKLRSSIGPRWMWREKGNISLRMKECHMKKKEYLQKSCMILEKVIRLENEFNFLVREYYLDTPEEKGEKRTEFYKEMSGIIDDFERTVFSMREKLNNPDSIQGYNTT